MDSRQKATVQSKWPAYVVMACSLLVLLLGAVVIIGWHIRNFTIVQVHPKLTAMQYLTAICFVFCGAGLAAHSLKFPRIFSMSCGAIAAIIGGVATTEYLSGWKLGIDLVLPYLPISPDGWNGRPSPPTSVGFTLGGTALIMLATKISPTSKRLAIWILGALMAALSSMALTGYATGLSETYVWGNFIGMALHTAIGMLFLSVGLCATPLMHRFSFVEDRWLPIPLGIGAVAAALIFWQALVADQQRAIRNEVEVVAQDLTTDALIRIQGPVRALERMKRRWEQRGGTPHGEWQSDAEAYIKDEMILDAIEWVDPSWKISWIVPAEKTALLVGLDLRAETRWNAVTILEQAQTNRVMALSPTFELKQGGRGFLIYLPLFVQEKFDGFLVGVFRLSDLMQSTMDEITFENYIISVYENDTLILGPDQTSHNNLAAKSKIEFYGHEWRFVVTPKQIANGRLPTLILCFGLLLAAAMAYAARAFQQTLRQNHAIRSAHRKLKEETAERRIAERERQASEERLRLVLDSATGISVISGDPSGVITYFSKGSERLLGYTAEEMVGKLSPAVFHDPVEVERRSIELTAELGREIRGFEVFVSIPRLRGSERREWTYICKDGSRRTVDLMVTVLSDAAGTTIGFLGTALDITASKAMEQQLLETLRAKETAQALLEAAGRIARLGHWEIPLDGSGPRWSDIIYAIHEVPLGTPISLEEAFAFFYPEDRPAIQDCVQRASKEGTVFEFEARLLTATGRQLWVHSRGEPVWDEKGKLVALYGVLQDISERHKAAELLEERNRQLEAATDRAEAQAQAKAEFLANMSHEIRTPLNAVIGMSELLMDVQLEPRTREFVDTIHTSGDVLLGLINDILDFSKIESGKLDLEHIPVSLRECVESALDLVARSAAKKHLDLLYWIDPDVPAAILGDALRLRQVFVNLAANAIKFTTKGEVFIKLSLQKNAPPWLHASVRDSGIGIPHERMDRLFSAFSQVDASTTRRFGGTGLGLAISHRLIEKMGGRIWVESEVGHGSNFQFEIPIQPADLLLPVAPEESDTSNLKGLRVLIVNHNPTNCRILQMQTESWAMLPIVVEDPCLALALIKGGEKFHLAILDMMIPEIDGHELAREIRKLRSAHELPILMLTSMGEPDIDTQALGISGVLTKPVKITSLLHAIRNIFAHTSPSPASRNPAPSQKLGDTCPLNILLADDNEVNQRVMTLLLQRMNYHPTIVSNGLEVLASLKREKFDVVMLDVQMPEMDGLEAAREICRLYPPEDRPWMIAVTAHAIEGDKDDCLVAGMNDYLTKPVRGEKLETVLRHAFIRRRS